MNRMALVLSLAAAATAASAQQYPDRAQVPEQHKWKLTDLFPTEEAWRQGKEAVAAEVKKIAPFKGTLASSPQRMLEALDLQSRLEKDLTRLFIYASLSADQDTREAKYQGMRLELAQLATVAASEGAFLEPEILALDPAKVEGFLKAEPKLAPWAHFLRDILRRKAHTGTEGEERILAASGLATSAPAEVYGLFANADFPYPTVKLSDGREVRLDQSAFEAARPSPNREDRRQVFEAFFGALGSYRRTFGATFNGAVQRDVFYAKARKYGSSVEAALDANNVPVAVYDNLVNGVNANLATFHRYLRLRQRILGVDKLHYYDLYAPLVPSVESTYKVEEAQKLVRSALAPLGADYVAGLERAFAERWIDVFPTPGKRAGAYSSGSAYDVHPYILLNYNGRYNDVSTLAHELGHTMHSFFSNKAQPFPTAGYPIFVAEVASTFNEALLVDKVLKGTTDDAARLSILGETLESIKGTVFRQTQFAEFELRAHQMAEKGEPLTGDTLDRLYMEIAKKYYGHDQGVCVVDDVVAHEWAFIPHFYRGYYVYQYATAYTASAALSEKVLAGDADATRRFRAFLASGGSKYPIDLLKDAGVDVTTREPLDLTVGKMNRIIDQMEAILDRKAAKK